MNKASCRTQVVILACLYAALGILLGFEYLHLPQRVATHFDLAGHPNGWMSRSSHLWFSAIFSLAFPMIPVGIAFAMRVVPPSAVNIPNRDYWLADERKQETQNWIFGHFLWFACITSAFNLGIQLLLNDANGRTPRQLPTVPLLCLAGLFIGALIGWVIGMIRHFSVRR